jgi:hypothetical protein
MTRISGPRWLRIKPLVPRVIPSCSGDKHPYAAAPASYPGAPSVFTLAAPIPAPAGCGPREHRRKEVRCRTRRNKPNLLEVLHRAAASCATQRAVTGLGKALRAGWVTGIGRCGPASSSRTDLVVLRPGILLMESCDRGTDKSSTNLERSFMEA